MQDLYQFKGTYVNIEILKYKSVPFFYLEDIDRFFMLIYRLTPTQCTFYVQHFIS